MCQVTPHPRKKMRVLSSSGILWHRVIFLPQQSAPPLKLTWMEYHRVQCRTQQDTELFRRRDCPASFKNSTIETRYEHWYFSVGFLTNCSLETIVIWFWISKYLFYFKIFTFRKSDFAVSRNGNKYISTLNMEINWKSDQSRILCWSIL